MNDLFKRKILKYFTREIYFKDKSNINRCFLLMSTASSNQQQQQQQQSQKLKLLTFLAYMFQLTCEHH